MAQPCPQIIEDLIRDVNPKWFHYNSPILANSQWRTERAGNVAPGSRRSLSTDRHGVLRSGCKTVRWRELILQARWLRWSNRTRELSPFTTGVLNTPCFPKNVVPLPQYRKGRRVEAGAARKRRRSQQRRGCRKIRSQAGRPPLRFFVQRYKVGIPQLSSDGSGGRLNRPQMYASGSASWRTIRSAGSSGLGRVSARRETKPTKCLLKVPVLL